MDRGFHLVFGREITVPWAPIFGRGVHREGRLSSQKKGKCASGGSGESGKRPVHCAFNLSPKELLLRLEEDIQVRRLLVLA